MKKWLVMTIIFIILVAGCIMESEFINKSFKNLVIELESFKMHIEATEETQIDTSTNIETIQDIHDNWHGKMPVLKSLMWHSGIKDIETGLARVEAYIKEEEKTEVLAELYSLIDFIDHYADDFVISIENIL